MSELDGSADTLVSDSSREPATGSAQTQPAVLERLLEAESAITRLGSYVPLHKLGQGGMGVVYAAYDEKLDRKVALKLLRGQGSEVARQRMVREARAMARLSHPNVAQVYGIEELGERSFIVVEYIDGVTLKAWLAERPRTRDEILAVFRSAGEGLAAAHAAGLVHRDFKPDNVMVRRDGRVLVMDFGLVHADLDGGRELAGIDGLAQPHLTQTGALLGTPAYMAPEQLLGRATDARSDQFSFCVALWEALHGQRPFAARTMKELTQAVTSGTLVEVERRDVPAWLRDVIVRGLAASPEQRWSSMPALLDALGHDPPRRRRRMAMGLGALGLGLAATVMIVGELERRDAALADTQDVLAQQQTELEHQRRSIDDAANVEKALQATLLVNERRGLEALVLAVEAAAAYGPDYMSAPTAVLQAMFDVQTVSVVGTSRVIEVGETLRPVVITPNGSHVVGLRGTSAIVWNRAGEQVSRLEGHVPPDVASGVGAIRLSPDGAPAEVLSGDARGRIWTAAGEMLFSPETGRIDVDGIWSSWRESVMSIDRSQLFSDARNVAVSPTGDLTLVHDEERDVIELRDSSHHIVSEILDYEGSGFFVADFARDGSRIALSPGSGPITVCDGAGRVLGVSEDKPITFAIAVAHDGSVILTGGQRPDTVERRDASGRSLASLAGHTESILALAFAGDASTWISASEDHTLRVWEKSKDLAAVVMGHDGPVYGLAIAPGGSWFVSASQDETVRFWTMHAPLAAASNSRKLIAAEIIGRSNDGLLVVTDEPYALWRADGQLLKKFDEAQPKFEFFPDSSALVTCTLSGRVHLWDRSGQLVNEIEVPESKCRIVFAPDSSRFYVPGKSKRHCIWGADGACLAHLPIDDVSVSWAAFADEGSRLLTRSSGDNVHVWDSNGRPIAEIPSQMAPAVAHAHGWMFAATCDEGGRLWNTSGDLMATLQDWPSSDECNFTAPGRAETISPDDRFVSLLVEGTVYVWTVDGALVETINVTSDFHDLDISPDGTRLAVSGKGGAQLWTLEGTRVATLLGVHTRPAQAVAFSPDGRWLTTKSSDTLGLGLWDPTTGRLLAKLPGRGWQTAFSDDGSRISQNRAPVRAWHVPGAFMRRACEILSEFPAERQRVASICEQLTPER
jgi:WD40 repeat protein/predicted Ser/Thr protein kinase